MKKESEKAELPMMGTPNNFINVAVWNIHIMGTPNNFINVAVWNIHIMGTPNNFINVAVWNIHIMGTPNNFINVAVWNIHIMGTPNNFINVAVWNIHIMGTPNNFINVAVWNIHSLFSKLGAIELNKMENIEFVKRLKSFEVLCLQGTHSGPKDTKSLSVEEYRVFPYHRKIIGNGRYFGGIIVLIKTNSNLILL